MEEEKEKGLKEILKEINDKLDENKKPKIKKGLWIPIKARVGRRKAKKGWATFMIIKDNRNIEFEKHKIDESTVVIDGAPRLATPDDMLLYKKKPFVILPSWSVKPFSPQENYEEAVKEGYTSRGWRLLLNRMYSEVVKPKRTISAVLIFILIIGLIVLGYFAIQGGWFK